MKPGVTAPRVSILVLFIAPVLFFFHFTSFVLYFALSFTVIICYSLIKFPIQNALDVIHTIYHCLIHNNNGA